MRLLIGVRGVLATLMTMALCAGGAGPALSQAPAVQTVAGMPAVLDPTNLYSETTTGKLSPAIASLPARVYVPHLKSNDVYVIDPTTLKVIDRFKVGTNPQH